MPIQFTCPQCGKSTTVADHYAGQSGPCSNCGQTITIPGSAGEMVAPPAKSGGGTGTLAVILVSLGIGAFVLFVCGGVLVALLLPAVQAAREAARRSQCSNNLKQIGLALHNYHDTYQTLPPAYMTDSDGNPTVSWRVLILPFLEQSPLYSQIDTQQAWDSPANAALQGAQISIYACPSSPGSPNTNYMVVTGPETLFPNEAGVRFGDVSDGLSNTIAVVEVEGQGAHWASPQDLDLQTMQMALNAGGGGQIGSNHPGGVQVLMADGSVRFFANGIDPLLLRSLLTRSGGESVNVP